MANINVHLETESERKFKELKFIFEAKTNEEAIEKIINIAFKKVKGGNKNKAP